MTALSDIRQLETQLHSHCLNWDDQPLQNELLYLLDELQDIHGKLDLADIPGTNADGTEMTLTQRVSWLIHQSRSIRSAAEPAHDFYGNPLPSKPQQLRLF